MSYSRRLAVRLEQHRNDVYSEWGEDGMIEAALRLLPETRQWCVEIGASNGRTGSNTRRLMEGGWSGVQIEADRRSFKQLERLYSGNKRAVCVNALVSFEGADTLDAVLGRTEIPQDFDLLSLDVDGADLHLWLSLVRYRPKLVVTEFNATIPNDIDFVQKADLSVHQGSSLAAFVRIAREKRYELVAVSEFNAFFVTEELFPLFGLEDNTVDAIRPGRDWQTRVFQLYDGTLCWEGCTRFLWHDTPFRNPQGIPRWLRRMPGTEPTAAKWLRRLYVRFVRRSWRPNA